MSLAVGEKLYFNEEQKDVVFLVGTDNTRYVRFPAHKLVLSAASSIFSAMLSKNCEAVQQVIIADVTSKAFACLLQFVYTGKFDAPTIAICKDVLFSAKKYSMPDLSKFCFAQLRNVDINIDNFWDFFIIVCTFYSEHMPTKIVRNTLEYLDNFANTILSNDQWNNLNSDCILKIVKRSSLKGISESKILNYVLQWSKMECCRQNLEVSAENVKNVLRIIKFEIRYLLIPRETLLSEPMNSVFLTQAEKDIILDGFLRETSSLPFPWNNKLLIEPRGQSNTYTFYSNFNTVPTDDTISTARSLLLVTSRDSVLETVQINIQPQNAMIHIRGYIRDLDGNVCDSWIKMGQSLTECTIKVGNPVCLKKFNLYVYSIICISGRVVLKYQTNMFQCDSANRKLLLVSDNPFNICSHMRDNFKLRDFWARAMSIPENSDALIHKTIIKAITITV